VEDNVKVTSEANVVPNVMAHTGNSKYMYNTGISSITQEALGRLTQIDTFAIYSTTATCDCDPKHVFRVSFFSLCLDV